MSLKHAINAKFNEFDIKGAVRFFSSLSSLAPCDFECLRHLKEKQPQAYPDNHLKWPNPPEYLRPVFTSDNIRKTISSYPTSSGAGIDGFQPQHLKGGISLLSGDTGLELSENLTQFVN